MPYEFEQQAPPATGVPVADIYVVRGVEERPQPSRELLAAVARLAPADHAMIRQLIHLGFQAMVRK